MEGQTTSLEFLQGKCLKNLLSTRVEGDGWFVAAPDYSPYGDYVWHRDNAECVMALDEYAATFGETDLFEITAKAILRSFIYFESKQKGVAKLSKMKSRLTNPEFYDSAYHIHARLSMKGDELSGPWNTIQYDSVARMVVALAKHLSLTRNSRLFERCKPGLSVAYQYLCDAIWDEGGSRRVLTVCANEWEEKDEPHLRGPIFSSVVGLLFASGKYSRSVLQQYLDLRDLDLDDYTKHTESMLKGFFVRDGVVRMLKRFDESPVGLCSTALWLLTTYDAFPLQGDVFRKTLDALVRSRGLGVRLKRGTTPTTTSSSSGGSGVYGTSSADSEGNSSSSSSDSGVVALRRYELTTPERRAGARVGAALTTTTSPAAAAAAASAPVSETTGHVDTYWGGQAWIITTAQLATAIAMTGDVKRARDILDICLRARDSEGRLPEQFEGTCYDQSYYERWREWSQERAPAPWLSWSHAEVLRAYTAIYRAW
jgi:hypothetical protein